ncbi:hypothetical protein VTI74DRAFT_11617 [Chaetomium olivicolor]
MQIPLSVLIHIKIRFDLANVQVVCFLVQQCREIAAKTSVSFVRIPTRAQRTVTNGPIQWIFAAPNRCNIYCIPLCGVDYWGSIQKEPGTQFCCVIDHVSGPEPRDMALCIDRCGVRGTTCVRNNKHRM